MRKLFKFKELLATIFAISSFAIAILKINSIGTHKLVADINSANMAILNIITLLLGILIFSTLNRDFYLIEKQHGSYTKSGWEDITVLEKKLKLNEEKTIYFVERTSSIAGQLIKNFSLFLWPLIIFYSLNILREKLGLHPDLNTKSFDKDTLIYVVLGGLANIFNLISAFGLCVCFSVLYQKTLDSSNKSTLNLDIYYFF